MCRGEPAGVASGQLPGEVFTKAGGYDCDSMLSSHQVEYKRGHDERISKFTTLADTPELLRAKTGGQLQSDVSNDEGRDSVILV